MAYVFDPDAIRIAAEKATSTYQHESNEKLIDGVIQNLAEVYPDQINDAGDWLFSVTGSAICQIKLVHVSLWEYLIIESYPVPMSCFTGRFKTTVYEFILRGREQYFRAGELDATQYQAGDVIVIEPKDAACVWVQEPLVSIDYSRGFIPSMFGLPVVDTLFGTLDFKSLFATMAQSNKLMWRSITGQPQAEKR